MTELQSIFDTVVNHAKAQKAKSIRDKNDPSLPSLEPPFVQTNLCAYRTNELKCFAGALIPEEKYIPQFENGCVYYINQEQGFYKVFNYQEEKLVSELQNIHDHTEPNEWHEGFQQVAKKYELMYDGTQLDYIK